MNEEGPAVQDKTKMSGMAARLREFMHLEAAGGITLAVVAVIAVLWVNSPLVAAYDRIFSPGLNHFINDGLMAVFFLLVGLEIKRELVQGELSTLSQALLPAAAAVGGMVVPMLFFWFFASAHPELRPGIAIPAATDIAFSLGLIALFGRRVPASLKIFLTALAIIDDLGAILLIAFLYTTNFALFPLLGAIAVWIVLLLLARRGTEALSVYLVGGLAVWIGFFYSGIHATIAGVLVAFAIPITDQGRGSPLKTLEHSLHPWVTFAIIPIFVLANSGVRVTGLPLSDLVSPLVVAIAVGLFVGKQIGVFAVGALLIKFGWARLPRGASWLQFYGISVATGIGFTMSLFIGLLAFPDAHHHDMIRLGVIVGSALSAALAAFVLAMGSQKSPP